MVRPDHEGMGLATRLLSMVVEWLRAEGTVRIWLEAPSDPARRAYGFYRARGWMPTGEGTGEGSESWGLDRATFDAARRCKTSAIRREPAGGFSIQRESQA
jgi:hypothetical protein